MSENGIKRLAYTVEEAATASALTRTRIYDAIGSGKLRSFKDGRRRLITADALCEFVSRLERDSDLRGSA